MTERGDFSEDAYLIRSHDVVERVIDEWDCLYIYVPSTGKLLNLNSAARLAWELLASASRIADLRKRWLACLGAPVQRHERLEADLQAVVDLLISEKLVEVSS